MRTFSKLVINDFENLFWILKQDTREILEERGSTIFFLLCLDWFICSFLVGPAEVLFWRGIWESNREILDNDIFQHNLIQSNLVSASLGFIATLFIDVFHHNLAGLEWEKSSAIYFVVCRGFSLFWGVVDIFYWKGIWEGVDACGGSHFSVPATTVVTGSVILFATMCVKSAVSSPVGITLDESKSHIECLTFLNTDQHDGFIRRVADALISRVIEAAVILTWHGIWTLTDCWFKMLGLDALRSALLSIIIGAIGSAIVFLLQFPLVYWKMKVTEKEKDGVDTNLCLLIGNMSFSYLGSYFCINSYRGIWYLMDLTFLPDHKLFGHFWSLFISALVLLLTNSVSCLHAGIVRDYPSEGVSIPFYYTSYFYIKNINKHIQKEKNKLVSGVKQGTYQGVME